MKISLKLIITGLTILASLGTSKMASAQFCDCGGFKRYLGTRNAAPRGWKMTDIFQLIPGNNQLATQKYFPGYGECPWLNHLTENQCQDFRSRCADYLKRNNLWLYNEPISTEHDYLYCTPEEVAVIPPPQVQFNFKPDPEYSRTKYRLDNQNWDDNAHSIYDRCSTIGGSIEIIGLKTEQWQIDNDIDGFATLDWNPTGPGSYIPKNVTIKIKKPTVDSKIFRLKLKIRDPSGLVRHVELPNNQLETPLTLDKLGYYQISFEVTETGTVGPSFDFGGKQSLGNQYDPQPHVYFYPSNLSFFDPTGAEPRSKKIQKFWADWRNPQQPLNKVDDWSLIALDPNQPSLAMASPQPFEVPILSQDSDTTAGFMNSYFETPSRRPFKDARELFHLTKRWYHKNYIQPTLENGKFNLLNSPSNSQYWDQIDPQDKWASTYYCQNKEIQTTMGQVPPDPSQQKEFVQKSGKSLLNFRYGSCGREITVEPWADIEKRIEINVWDNASPLLVKIYKEIGAYQYKLKKKVRLDAAKPPFGMPSLKSILENKSFIDRIQGAFSFPKQIYSIVDEIGFQDRYSPDIKYNYILDKNELGNYRFLFYNKNKINDSEWSQIDVIEDQTINIQNQDDRKEKHCAKFDIKLTRTCFSKTWRYCNWKDPKLTQPPENSPSKGDDWDDNTEGSENPAPAEGDPIYWCRSLDYLPWYKLSLKHGFRIVKHMPYGHVAKTVDVKPKDLRLSGKCQKGFHQDNLAKDDHTTDEAPSCDSFPYDWTPLKDR